MKNNIQNSIIRIFTLVITFAAIAFSSEARAIEVGETAPCIKLQEIYANSSVESNACITDRLNPNHKFTILEFFSMHCSYCVREMPSMNQFALKNSDIATFRLVSIDRGEAELRNFVQVQAANISGPVAMDLARQAKTAYKVNATPTYFVLDSNYKVIFKNIGTLGANQKAAIEALLRAE